MITAITAEPLSISTGISDYRNRVAPGERVLLQDSAPPAPKNSGASENGQFPQERKPAQPQPEPPQRDQSSMFAAAVISGALSPTPKTMEELMQRIGTSTIPEEAEARLKDLIA